MTRFVEHNSPEWPAMWEALKRAAGDYENWNPLSREAWQYMGTYNGRHNFRHRDRPDCFQPIKGYAGRHTGRVYIDIDEESLKIVRVVVTPYIDDPKPVTLKRFSRDDDYSGSFDGFSVTSDADPGL